VAETSEYALGSEQLEIERLDYQAGLVEAPTRLLLTHADLRHGARVLDLGTGLGHVALLVSDLVGPEGAVTGIDESEVMLENARARAAAAGASNVTFVHADARAWASDVTFDAVVARLLLLHLQDRVNVLRGWRRHLAPGGRVVLLEFDINAVRSEPPVSLVDRVVAWMLEGFRQVGVEPGIGARLQPLLSEAGYSGVDGFGVQMYMPAAPAARVLAGIVQTLAPVILARGIATRQELELDTLETRIGEALERADAMYVYPPLVGAWGEVAG
jgi:SAM-dependent methyltransferase